MKIDPSITLLRNRIRDLEDTLREVIEYIENDASEVPWMGDWRKVLNGSPASGGTES